MFFCVNNTTRSKSTFEMIFVYDKRRTCMGKKWRDDKKLQDTRILSKFTRKFCHCLCARHQLEYLQLLSISNIMCSPVFWITRERKQLENCDFHQSKEETGGSFFLKYCIRQNYCKTSHFCKTLQKMHDNDLSFRWSFDKK